MKRNSQRQGNDAARNVWQPTKNTLINQTPPTESLVQSLTVGRSELVGDWKHRRSAIEAWWKWRLAKRIIVLVINYLLSLKLLSCHRSCPRRLLSREKKSLVEGILGLLIPLYIYTIMRLDFY
jgi:hypothetical protein